MSIFGKPLQVLILSKTITIMGAPGETVTYSGAESGSVTLDSNGDATVSLRSGTYTFVGSISGTKSNVTVSGGAVTMWPDNVEILYWYGRYGTGITAGTALGGTSYANRSVTFNANDIVTFAGARGYNGSHSTYAAVYFAGANTTGKTSVGIIITDITNSGYSGGTRRRTIGQSSSAGGAYTQEITAAGTYTIPLDSNTYIGARNYVGNSNTSYANAYMTIGAYWLE